MDTHGNIKDIPKMMEEILYKYDWTQMQSKRVKLKTETKENKETKTEETKYGLLIALNTSGGNQSSLNIGGILYDETCNEVLNAEHILNVKDNQLIADN